MTTKAIKPPPGYQPLPKGARCRCLLMWDDGHDNFYCCKMVGASRPLPPKKKKGKIVMREVSVE